MALFLVLIAAMNYMNLSTARSSSRAREVGLRKVVGSRRGPLVLQFLSESVIFTVISLGISIILLMALLPRLNLLAGKSFDMNVIHSPVVLLGMLGVVLLVGFIGGSYPAFFLSRFSPVTVLKGEITQGTAGSLFRKVLVVLQFTVSVIMIAFLGLFGLASYTVEQRTREIGIRKVFGANERTILKLVTRDFIILSIISIVIAFPIAYYFMSNWLENYVYKSSMGPVVFILAGLLTLVITFVTISYKAYQAAVTNPADSIKTE